MNRKDSCVVNKVDCMVLGSALRMVRPSVGQSSCVDVSHSV